MNDAEREAEVLEILKPHMKYDRETNIGCGSAREIQRQVVELIQRAEQRGMERQEYFYNQTAFDAGKKQGLLRGAEIAKKILWEQMNDDHSDEWASEKIAEAIRKEAT